MPNRVKLLDSCIGLAFSRYRILKKLGGGMGVVTVAGHACLHDNLRSNPRVADLLRKRRLALCIKEQRPRLDSDAACKWPPPTDPPIRLRISDYVPAAASLYA